MTDLTIIRRDGAYWIRGYLEGDCGPYDTKAEAEEDRAGLLRFEKYEDRKGYVTTEKQ